MIKTILYISFLSTFTLSCMANSLCKKWGESIRVGTIDTSLITESSGLAVSAQFDRLYHINDSGDGPNFYWSQLNGEETKKVKIRHYIPIDVEDLAYGDYKGEKTLFIGDIGDNGEKRKSIKVLLVTEEREFGDKVSAKRKLKLVYPDRPHNAEGMALHPNGDLYILTKEVDFENNRAVSAELFRLSKQELEDESKNTFTLEHIKSLELPYLLYDFNLWGRIVTGFDISQDGKRALIMTYGAAIEVNLDFINPLIVRMWDVKKFTIYPTLGLPQIETVSYSNDGKGFYYTSEFHKKIPASAGIYKVMCKSTAFSLVF